MEKETQIEELVGNQHQSSEVAPRSKKKQERREQSVRIRTTAREAIKKSWRDRAIERKKVRGDDPIKYFLYTGIRHTY